MKKNTSINTRFADENDAGIILNFLKELAGHHNDADAVTATESRLMKHINQKTYICLIAEETVGTEKVPLGIALLWTSFSSWRGKEGLHLDDLYVSPKARGKGVGLLLLQRCAKLTIERNYHRLEWIVSNSNTKAIEFYRSVGSIFLGDYITVRFTDDTFKRLENPPPMPKGYEMRRATPDDAEVVYDLICELAQINNFPADMLQTTPDLVKQCLSGEDSPFEVILVEHVDGTTRTAVGYALYYSSFASWRARETLTIEDLYVAPNHRDKHIGQILLCEAIRIAKERKCTRVDGIVFASNTKVLKKYAKFGAKIMDDWILCRLGGGKLYRFAAGRSKL